MMTSRYGMVVTASRIACAIALAAGICLLMPQRVYARPSAETICSKTILDAKKKTSTTSVGALNSLMAGDGAYVYFAEASSNPGEGPTLRKVSRTRADGSDYRCIYEGDGGDFISGLKLCDGGLRISEGCSLCRGRREGILSGRLRFWRMGNTFLCRGWLGILARVLGLCQAGSEWSPSRRRYKRKSSVRHRRATIIQHYILVHGMVGTR